MDERRKRYLRDYRRNYGDLMKEQIREWWREHPGYRHEWQKSHQDYFRLWRESPVEYFILQGKPSRLFQGVAG